MIDLSDVMATLAKGRPLFHSEADFQHAFAWEVHVRLPGSKVRLELPVRREEGDMHLDVLVRDNNRALAVELKYKTRKAVFSDGDETYILEDHVAQPRGRYDFWTDVERLESVVSTFESCTGVALLLTNDSAYWKPPRSDDDASVQFSMAQGRQVFGKLGWTVHASSGTRGNREQDIQLTGTYRLNWCPYSKVPTQNYAEFRYLPITVVRKGDSSL